MLDAVGGNVLFTNTKIACSGAKLILFLMTYTNCPTVMSCGTRYFDLSIGGNLSSFDSTTIGIRFGYFSIMRLDSSLRCSKSNLFLKSDIIILI